MKPILREFPYSFDTDRLTIRGPLPGDGAPLREAVLESQESLKEWMPWAVSVATEEAYEIRVREGQLKFLAREDLWMMLLLRNSGTIVGGTGLHRVDWSVPKFEIGYWVRSRFSGKGYITEAVLGLSEFAFKALGAKRIEIRCDQNNSRSAAVAKRANFDLEAIIRNDDRHHLTGSLRNTLLFSRVADDG